LTRGGSITQGEKKQKQVKHPSDRSRRKENDFSRESWSGELYPREDQKGENEFQRGERCVNWGEPRDSASVRHFLYSLKGSAEEKAREKSAQSLEEARAVNGRVPLRTGRPEVGAKENQG